MSIKSLKSLLFSKRFGKLYVFVDVQLLILLFAVCCLPFGPVSPFSSFPSPTLAAFCWACDNDIAPNGSTQNSCNRVTIAIKVNNSMFVLVFLTALNLIFLSPARTFASIRFSHSFTFTPLSIAHSHLSLIFQTSN